MDSAVLVLLVIIGALLAALLVMLMRRTSDPRLDTVSQLLLNADAETRRNAERLAALGSVPQALANLATESRAVSERLVRLEGMPTQASQVNERLVKLEPVTQAVEEIRTNLKELQATARGREDLERRTAESIRRLELVMSGTQSSGAAGENLLDAVFGQIPAEWRVRNFRVGNRVVEFGLRLPNDLVVPIDSKWAASALVAQFSALEQPEERAVLKKQIENTVVERAREVTKYIDPGITASFAIAVLPDAVFELCTSVQPQMLRDRVVVLSHSLFIPYLLMVFQGGLVSSRTLDMEKLDAYLQDAARGLEAIEKELQGRLSMALKMLGNSREHMGAQVSHVRGGLTGLHIASGSKGELPLPAEVMSMSELDASTGPFSGPIGLNNVPLGLSD